MQIADFWYFEEKNMEGGMNEKPEQSFCFVQSVQ
jgi:hypothetical protein